MYDLSDTEIGLVIVIQLGVCILLLAEIANGVQGYATLVGLGGRVIGTGMALGGTLVLLRRRRFGIRE